MINNFSESNKTLICQNCGPNCGDNKGYEQMNSYKSWSYWNKSITDD